jgi:CheY-like chemotaxis protein
MKSILLIEDEPMVALLQERLLQEGGFTVTKVESLDEARQALAQSLPDLIFSDLQLGTGTPEDTIWFLGQISSTVPIVICSGSLGCHGGDKLAAECEAAGFMDLMQKLEVRDPATLRQRLERAFFQFNAHRGGNRELSARHD